MSFHLQYERFREDIHKKGGKDDKEIVGSDRNLPKKTDERKGRLMKKKMKRIAAFLLASIMVLASCMAVLAAEQDPPVKPTADDRGTITVTDVKAEATVTAYQIVQAKYNDSGFVGYELVSALADALENDADFRNEVGDLDITEPTAAQISAIARRIAKGELALPAFPMGKDPNADLTAATAAFTAEVGAGEYIAIASGASDIIYNPILLSVYYSVSGSDNTMVTGTVDANTVWEINGVTGHAKSSEPTVTKQILNPNDGENTDGHGSDAAFDDSIQYQITATIPSYSAEYQEVEYIISDTLSDGLIPPAAEDIEVQVDQNAPVPLPEPSNPPMVVAVDGQTITVTFDSDYILANGGKEVTVTYSAILDKDKATVNMDANTNEVTLAYSNDPSDYTSHAEKEDKTYVYTFELDGNVNGSQTFQNFKTHEIIKVNENGEIETQSFEQSMEESTVTNALSGATFTLTNRNTGKVYTATTTENGYFDGFKGLDAGEYTLVETAAPEGYTIDDTIHTVHITAAYNPDGTLASYTILIDGKATSTYTAAYAADETIIEIDSTSETTYIKNTRMQNLPSTGGIGTYIFTVLGVALMVIAAVLYMRRRKQT